MENIIKCGVERQLENIDIGVITSAALVDSINPCAIAVLLILIAGLIGLKNKKIALKSGLAFILGLFLAYLGFGLGLFSALSLLSYAKIFHTIVGVFAILIGLYYVNLYIWPPKKEESVCIGGICADNSPVVKTIMKVNSIPTAFVAGIIVSFFELPCTGGPYFFTLGLLSENCTWATIVPWLLYYNVIFVLPLLIIVWVFYAGRLSIEKANQLKNRYQRIIELIAGLIMVGLGVWVILN